MVKFLLILIILLIILVGMTIHEIGHFVFAKIFKVNVKEFSLGVGFKIFQIKTKSGMLFSIRCIPLMAYVLIDSWKLIDTYKDILNDHMNEEKEVVEKLSRKLNSKFREKINSFKLKMYYSNWKKYEYLASESTGTNKIEDVRFWKRFLIYFGGVFFNLLMFFLFWVIYIIAYDFYNPMESIGNSLLLIIKNMAFIKTGESGTIIGSIVGSNINHVNEISLKFFLEFVVLFSFMLFIFNLLPIPPLDGYKIVIDSLETTFKFKINKKVDIIFSIIGMCLLLYIFITSIVADIRK